MAKNRNKTVILIIIFILIGFTLGWIGTCTYDLPKNGGLYKMVSSNMQHDQKLDVWWQVQKDEYEKYGITKEEFERFPFSEGINKKDILIIKNVPFSQVSIGDIVIANVTGDIPWITRVINMSTKQSDQYITTKGDRNPTSTLLELRIPADRIKGKVVSVLG